MQQFDKNMIVPKVESELSWYDGSKMTIEGKGWSDTESIFSRLPKKAKGVVREEVWSLGLCSAGISVCFVTDSSTLAVRWDGFKAMNHMPATGVSGLDLYVKHEGKWRWLAVGRPTQEDNENLLFKGLDVLEREYMLYLPLYNPLNSIFIGVSHEAKIKAGFKREKLPILFYGTSITQGGCASRPGMCYSAILGRYLDMPVVNLGFSGNGKMEPEVVDLISEVRASVVVLDFLPNLEEPYISDRLEPALHKLRKANPSASIVLVENINYCNSYLVKNSRDRFLNSNQTLRSIYDRFISNGFEKLFYVDSDGLIGVDGEGTVDGTHLTDLGYIRFADKALPVLKKALVDVND